VVARQLPATQPAPGSPESFKQASDIIGGLAKGLRSPGGKNIPLGKESGDFLGQVAEALAKGSKAVRA
jgi:hypothetical protein